MTQRELILRALRRNPSGCCLVDFEQEQRGLGYTSRNRVAELRKSGTPIHSERCTVHQHRSSVARYRLLPISEQVRIML